MARPDKEYLAQLRDDSNQVIYFVQTLAAELDSALTDVAQYVQIIGSTTSQYAGTKDKAVEKVIGNLAAQLAYLQQQNSAALPGTFKKLSSQLNGVVLDFKTHLGNALGSNDKSAVEAKVRDMSNCIMQFESINKQTKTAVAIYRTRIEQIQKLLDAVTALSLPSASKPDAKPGGAAEDLAGFTI